MQLKYIHYTAVSFNSLQIHSSSNFQVSKTKERTDQKGIKKGDPNHQKKGMVPTHRIKQKNNDKHKNKQSE